MAGKPRARGGIETTAQQAAAETADAEARGLLRSKQDQFDGALGAHSGALQGPDGFEAAQHADRAIVHAGVGNGVNVGAGGDGREVRILARPSREGIAYGVFTDFQSGFGTKALHVSPCRQIGGREDDARDGRSRRVRVSG